MSELKKIRFYKGRHAPNFWDSLWIKRELFKRKNNSEVKITVRFTLDSIYNVTPASDQADWLKIGGYGSFRNFFKKQKERLAAFRNFRIVFEICNYDRNGNGFEVSNLQDCVEGIEYIITIKPERGCRFPIGAWAGGTGLPLNDFEIFVGID